MRERIIKALKEYYEMCDIEKKHELTSLMADINECDDLWDSDELNMRIDMLQDAIVSLMAYGKGSQIRVPRKDFVQIHDKCVVKMDENQKIADLLYGEKASVTVQWNGLYCDCQDGATVSNYVFPAIHEMEEELGGDEC